MTEIDLQTEEETLKYKLWNDIEKWIADVQFSLQYGVGNPKLIGMYADQYPYIQGSAKDNLKSIKEKIKFVIYPHQPTDENNDN